MSRKAKFKLGEQVVLAGGLLMNVTRAQYEYRGKQVVDVKDLEEERKRVPVSEVNRLPEALTGNILGAVPDEIDAPESQYPNQVPTDTFGEAPLNKYQRKIRNKYGEGIVVDVYDVLNAYGVTDPATAHAIKKLLMPGERGAKDTITDLNESVISIERAIDQQLNIARFSK